MAENYLEIQRLSYHAKQYQLVMLLVFNCTVKLGNKELFGHPKIVPYCQKFLILMK